MTGYRASTEPKKAKTLRSYVFLPFCLGFDTIFDVKR